MEQICALALCLLVSLCSARSPVLPSVIPLDCNATQVLPDLAVDLINEDRDEGFVLKPVRIKSVFQQESVKMKGGFIYYLDLDVIETTCSVVSGKKWKECNDDISFHKQVSGQCKAIILIAKPWRILKLLNYNCTLSTVPSSTIVRICPDCPTVIDITDELKEKADLMVQKFNADGNETRYFKVNNVERVRSQWVFGASYFLLFTIKETDCLKTQADVNLAKCNFLKDNEAEVGFCKGNSYTSIEQVEVLDVSCEIYDPTDDDNSNEQCGLGEESSKFDQRKKNHDAKGRGEAGPDRHRHKHGRRHRGHRHHHCHHGHHHKHAHPHHHHHHHHHHHQHMNHTNQHDKSHDHHGHRNHTSEGHGSSSEENNDNKPHEKRTKGSVQIYYLTDDSTKVPTPTISRPPPSPGRHRKYKFDNIDFPNEDSPLKTCPGEPLVDLPQVVQDNVFA
ncbi:fetuin-B-like [Mixophyes fleayi]|uniref:fetuin-B-like n=1 Tax=Mixophyes fleayi TaxID=3061075 RepID=UPI003F4DD690